MALSTLSGSSSLGSLDETVFESMEAEVLAADTVLAQVLDDSGSESMETELVACSMRGGAKDHETCCRKSRLHRNFSGRSVVNRVSSGNPSWGTVALKTLNPKP